MQPFKIATWNVNSLRVRLPHVLSFLEKEKPDILALQELKLPTEEFPYDAIRETGYFAAVSGQKTYNGVAVLSREEAKDIVTDIPDLEDHQRRVLGVTINDIRVLDLYVPNGESVTSEKYQYKLNWLSKLDVFLKHEIKKYPKLIVLGDFNIAPTELDVHDPKLWEGNVLFSEPERKAFQDILQIGFIDCFRQLSPTEPGYTWWDYRMNAFKRKMGLRIDHILASHPLLSHCKKCYVDQLFRSLERPSDHAPVVADFA
jgi:exodeoxyribonuclease-3